MRKLITKFKRGKLISRCIKLLFNLSGTLPVKKNVIVFESFSGKQFSDNPRALYEYIKENYPEMNLYWSIDGRYKTTFQQFNIKILKRFSLSWFLTMPRAEYWIVNTRLPLWIKKPRHTSYIQTWHGTPLKKLANDMDEVYMPGTNTQKYKKNFTSEARKWDYLISPNNYSTKIFTRAFDFRKRVIESGYPRNDYLYQHNNEDEIKKIKLTLGIPAEKKVILYAPTWRDDQFYEVGKYKFDLKLDLDNLKEQLGSDYVVILRMHYLISENFDVTPYEGFAYDYSTYTDIRELYLISDILITDYSSVFFDYANLKRPIIFYAYDIDNYRDKLRGFYFNIEKEAPGPLAKTTEDVISEIKNFENTVSINDYGFEEFYNRYCYLEDGKASKRVAENIFRRR